MGFNISQHGNTLPLHNAFGQLNAIRCRGKSPDRENQIDTTLSKDHNRIRTIDATFLYRILTESR